MFEKRLNKEDLEQLRERSKMINQYFLVVKALQLQTEVYMKNLLPKYGADMNKNYEVDLKNGIIKEKKNNKEEKQ